MSSTIKTGYVNPAPAMYCSLYGHLKEKAVELGYALAVHGSMQRDFDLVAIPWTDEAAEPEILVEALRKICGGFILADGTPAGRWDSVQKKFVGAEVRNPSIKPHGRMAWNIHLGGQPMIDLSVMPRSPIRIPPGPGGKGGDNS
jgi:hypothetical protein